MFETLNAILGTDILRYSLMMGTGALMAYTLHPLPSAMDSFTSSNILKFGTLFLFGLLMAGTLNLSKFMVVFFSALLIMILFEYFRQIDKGLTNSAAVKAAAKEFMWGNDPMSSYDAETPYADPRMGIPQYLPDGVTPAVTFVGDAGGESNTGNYRMPEHMMDALYQNYPLSYPDEAPYGDKDWGVPSQMPDGSPGLVYASHVSEGFMNPISASFVELRALSTKGLNMLADASRDVALSVGIRDKERYENRVRSALLQIRDLSQQGINAASQMGRNIAANMGVVEREQFANPIQAAFLEIKNASQRGINAASQMGRNMAASVGLASRERLANPLQNIFNQVQAVSKRGIAIASDVASNMGSAIGLRESFNSPLDNALTGLQGITQRGIHAATQFGRGVVSAAGLKPEALINPLDASFVLPTKGLGVLIPSFK